MVEDILERRQVLLSEHVGQPLGLIGVGVVVAERGEVVCHVEKHLRLHLHGFDVAHVEQPVAVGSCGIGLQQFLIHQHGRGGGNPQVVVWHAAIADVVVNTAAAAAPPFLLVAHPLHVAIVVVGPHKGDVLWHPQAGIVDVERLLVRHENLRYLRFLLVLVFREDGALLSEDLLQGTGAVLGVGAAPHGFVVQAAHAHGVYVVVFGGLADAVVEFPEDGLAVGLVVPLAFTLPVPFRRGGVVEEQGLAVAGGDHDAPLVGHDLALGMAVEGSRAGVHGRRHHVALQTQNQFADAVVGLGANVAQVLLEGPSRPRLQAPVLVVDEEAAIFHGG